MGNCYTSIFYDPFRNKVFLKEIVNGQTFVDTIHNQFEYFVEDPKQESPIKDIYGKSFLKKVANNRETIRLLKDSGVAICESDISQDIKFLHKRFEGRELKPDIKDFQVCTIDIEIETGSTFPKPGEANYPINLITVHLSKQNKTYSFGNRPYEGLPNFKCIEDETEMLEAFMDFFQKAKVNIITGWNVAGFDIPYIINRCAKLGVEKTLSSIGKYWQNKRSGEWSIPGIAVLDYMQFYKDPKFVQERQESYSLQYICTKEIGEGKLELDGFINDAYKKNWKQYVDYNIQDVMLVVKLDQKKRFIEFAINICHKSLIPFDKVFSASAIIEGQLLIYLHENNLVMNDRNEGILRDELEGAYVESVKGPSENNISLDVESLYPSNIEHFNISPETLVLNPKNIEGLIKTPLSESHGIYYTREKGILPTFISKNKVERKHFKELKKQAEKEGNKELAEYYDSQQAIRKVILNSCYGVMSLFSFHYYNIHNARTVTLSGQNLIKYLRDKTNLYFKDHFYKDKRFFSEVNEKNKLYKDLQCIVDTDSLFLTLKDVKKKLAPNEPFIDWANKFYDGFLSPFYKHLLNKYFEQFGVENNINFKIEKIISKMVVFGDKNYACKILSNEGVVYPKPKMTITGWSSKRSSTPAFCRVKLNELMEKFFENVDFDNPNKTYMIDLIKEVKKHYQECSIEEISFPKGVSDFRKYAVKSTESYVTDGLTYETRTPIHHRAGMVYNYLVHKYQLPNQPVNDGSKLKFFYVKEKNELKTNVVGFMGNCPEFIKQNFQIDYEQMFQVSFIQPMQKLFDVMNWGNIDIETADISSFFEV